MKHLLVDPDLAERVSLETTSERTQKIIGTIAVMLSLGALITFPFLPSSPNQDPYELCGHEGISREIVNRAISWMSTSTATRDEKLAVFLQTFQNSSYEFGLEICGRAILHESEKGKKPCPTPQASLAPARQ